MASTWETLEERERRVRGTRTTSATARAAQEIPEATTLKAAFAERPFISREDLRNIARQPYERPVITFYLNLAPQQGVRSDPPVFVSIFHSLRHRELEARKPYIEGLPRAHRLAIPDDLAEVQAFLEGYQPSGARALVIFKSGEQLNRVMPLPARVADSLTIDADPYIAPLEAIMEEQRRVLVVDLAKPLRDRLLADLRLSPEDGPNQRRDALEAALATQRKQEEETALGELGFFQGHGRLAAGLDKVLGAANLFLMRRLFLDTELALPGFVCREHHFLALQAGSCPFDGEALPPAENVIDELVEIARLHGVELMLVGQRRELLAPYEGAAAVLVTAVPLEELRTVSVTSQR